MLWLGGLRTGDQGRDTVFWLIARMLDRVSADMLPFQSRIAAQLDALHVECVEAREPLVAKIAGLPLCTTQSDIAQELAAMKQGLFAEDMDDCLAWAEQELMNRTSAVPQAGVVSTSMVHQWRWDAASLWLLDCKCK